MRILFLIQRRMGTNGWCHSEQGEPSLGVNELSFHASATGPMRTKPMEHVQLKPGKVPPEILTRIVFKNLGASDSDVIIGPEIGQDASVIRIGDKDLIASTDPITGSIEDVGWLAVHINANDIATFGVRPRWFLASILLPDGSTSKDLERIMLQIDEAARSLGIAVVGGHTEITEAVSHPIIVGIMHGLTKHGKYVTSSGAQPGDAIIMTKTAAIEGTSILATECSSYLHGKVPDDVLYQAQQMRFQISVVAEGIAAFETGYVTAMHDPTEGGVFGGIHEICDASNVGCKINHDMIPIHPVTSKICDALEVDVYSLISSGTMLLTCSHSKVDEVIDAITRSGVDATVIGKTINDPARRLLIKDSQSSLLPRPETDALWTGLKHK